MSLFHYFRTRPAQHTFPGEGWFLGSVHDTGDGPACNWFRHITKS